MLRGGRSPGYWNASLRGKRSENSSSHWNSNPGTLDYKERRNPMRLGDPPTPLPITGVDPLQIDSAYPEEHRAVVSGERVRACVRGRGRTTRGGRSGSSFHFLHLSLGGVLSPRKLGIPPCITLAQCHFAPLPRVIRRESAAGPTQTDRPLSLIPRPAQWFYWERMSEEGTI